MLLTSQYLGSSAATRSSVLVSCLFTLYFLFLMKKLMTSSKLMTVDRTNYCPVILSDYLNTDAFSPKETSPVASSSKREMKMMILQEGGMHLELDGMRYSFCLRP